MGRKHNPASQLCVNLRSSTVVCNNLGFDDAVTGSKLIIGALHAHADPISTLFCLDWSVMRTPASGRQHAHYEARVGSGLDSHPEQVVRRAGDMTTPEEVAVLCHPHCPTLQVLTSAFYLNWRAAVVPQTTHLATLIGDDRAPKAIGRVTIQMRTLPGICPVFESRLLLGVAGALSVTYPKLMQDAPPPAPEITEQAKAEAKSQPNGWVYAIGGGYNNTEGVPPQAIRGAWKVDAHGNITGEFKPNPNYDPNFRKPAQKQE